MMNAAGMPENATTACNEQLLERVTGLYRVRPEISFVQIATLIESRS